MRVHRMADTADGMPLDGLLKSVQELHATNERHEASLVAKDATIQGLQQRLAAGACALETKPAVQQRLSKCCLVIISVPPPRCPLTSPLPIPQPNNEYYNMKLLQCLHKLLWPS